MQEAINVMQVMRSNWKNIIFVGVIFGAVAFLATIFMTRAFAVQTDFLVIQRSASSQDFYTLSKSVEYAGGVLKEAIASDLFYEEAVNTGHIDSAQFPTGEKDRLEEWRKVVTVNQRSAAGILEVNVEHNSRPQALGISKAISEVLIEKNHLFRYGEESDITVKIISGPIADRNPSVAELIAAVIAGMIMGGLLMTARAVYREQGAEALLIQEQEKYKNEEGFKNKNKEEDVDESMPGNGLSLGISGK